MNLERKIEVITAHRSGVQNPSQHDPLKSIQSNLPVSRHGLSTRKTIRLRQVSAHERFKIQCLYVVGTISNCSLFKESRQLAEVHLYTAKVHLFKLAASKLMDKKYRGPIIFISVDISKSLVCFFTVERFIVKEDENQSLTLSRFCWFLLSRHWKEKTVTIQYVESGLQDLINV